LHVRAPAASPPREKTTQADSCRWRSVSCCARVMQTSKQRPHLLALKFGAHRFAHWPVHVQESVPWVFGFSQESRTPLGVEVVWQNRDASTARATDQVDLFSSFRQNHAGKRELYYDVLFCFEKKIKAEPSSRRRSDLQSEVKSRDVQRRTALCSTVREPCCPAIRAWILVRARKRVEASGRIILDNASLSTHRSDLKSVSFRPHVNH